MIFPFQGPFHFVLLSLNVSHIGGDISSSRRVYSPTVTGVAAQRWPHPRMTALDARTPATLARKNRAAAMRLLSTAVCVSLPQFMNFKLFGKTILVVNIKFGLFLGHPLSK